MLDYVADRDAQLVRAEATGDDGQFHYDEFFENVEERLTFKAWLQTHAGADYPYPRFDRPEPIDYQAAMASVEIGWPATSSSETFI